MRCIMKERNTNNVFVYIAAAISALGGMLFGYDTGAHDDLEAVGLLEDGGGDRRDLRRDPFYQTGVSALVGT